MLTPSGENLPSASRTTQILPVSPCAMLTVQCLICDKLLHASNLRHHRALHRSLSTLQYHVGKSPVSLLSLRLRRRGVIAKKARSKKWNPMALEKIDFAYEMVKSHRISSWPFLSEEPIVCTEERPRSLRMPGKTCIKSLGVSQDMNAPWTSRMEDVCVFMDRFGGRSNAWFIGLFDGFHGTSAAELASKDLPLLVLQQLILVGYPYELCEEERAHLSGYNPLFRWDADEKSLIAPTYSAAAENKGPKDRFYGPVHMAFAKAFCKMDRILRLGRNESSKVRWSGCTATVCLLEPSVSHIQNLTSERGSCEIGMLHVANAGDVDAVMCKNGKGYRLTGNHSTSNRKERKRILHTGGTISKNKQHGLVEGITQSTRGLGYHGDPKLKTAIVPIPYTVTIPVDSSCQFLLLASSGFWKVLNRHEVVSITLQMLSLYFGSFNTGINVSRTLHIMDRSEEHIGLGSSILHLLDEFSEQGHDAAVISTERLFEELLIRKKYAIRREHVEHLLMQHSLMDVNGRIWQSLDRLLDDIVMKEESMHLIEHVTAEFPLISQHSSNLSVVNLLQNSSDKGFGTSVTNFPEKPLSEMEEIDRTTTVKFSEEILKEENIDRTSVAHFAEERSALEGPKDQENITKEKKQELNFMSPVQVEISMPETIVIDRSYDEAFTMNQDEDTEVTSQETELQYETIAKNISEQLVQTAKLAGACDNITVLILLLPGCAKTFSVEQQQ